MKNLDIFKFAEENRDKTISKRETVIDGMKITVFRHFTGEKDLNKIIFENAYKKASEEVLNCNYSA